MSALGHQNLVVVGGGYVGTNVAKQLAAQFHGQYHVLLIERNSHFQHRFAFPRYAVTTEVPTRKAFIPYAPGTFADCPPESGTVLQARVVGLRNSAVQLDRKVYLGVEHLDSIPYAFLVIVTGSKSIPPSSLPEYGKQDGVMYLRKHASQIMSSSKIVVIGGGAVGIQMATDIKELYPDKSATIVHSRKTLMDKFHPNLDKIVVERCTDLGIGVRLGSRVKFPAEGYPTDGKVFQVECEDGSKTPADFAIICTGQVPQSSLVQSLSPDRIDENGFIQVLKTLQLSAEHPHVFAIGDVAATGAAKAAKPGTKQAELVVKNIQHILNGEQLEEYEITEPPGIHLTLGITKSVAFGNPFQNSSEPFTKHRDDGRLDMNIDRIWARKGGGADSNL